MLIMHNDVILQAEPADDLCLNDAVGLQIHDIAADYFREVLQGSAIIVMIYRLSSLCRLFV